ncbi:aldehyde dehydrogenase family protein [Rhizobium lusitanum]|uniref:Aldehyde dehydrogenase family protein n=1 Tax=Rhizobium lusitanum TaxID=293958 RepID=A0A6L9UH39_9HYPH|nr:NAD-dependent succinate-semialdehyde dehydrogenase [Rhizobium lusitanum]NEI73672.1 aldehyde dehydrogenase family protein [Rhizobium lusitanum]
MYPKIQLYIDGRFRDASNGQMIEVINPATGEVIGGASIATKSDMDEALASAEAGFKLWRSTSAYDRCKLIRKAADIIRERMDEIAAILTTEQGKPLAESKLELGLSVDILDWCAEEGRRAYGRVIPSRGPTIQQLVVHEPVGPVAAFTPWNFPVSQLIRKVGAALAAGCSIVVKAAEETPGSPVAVVKAFHDAGVPKGVLGLLFGVPADISSYLVPNPIIRKISFTGSVPVGKHLAAMAGTYMKPATMELGGHAPVFVFDDVDVGKTAATLVTSKYRNAGQVCVSPTRFLVHENVYDEFLDKFVAGARSVVVGNGLHADTRMGPLVNEKRVTAVDTLVQDAVKGGAELLTGGRRISNAGSFYEPTVLANVTTEMRAMNEEPFGPVALVRRFSGIDEVIEEANRLPFGLASYAFARSTKTISTLAREVSVGMMTINHLGIGLPETHFGGVRDSGYGSEGGPEAVEAYLVAKFLTQDTAA